MRSPFFSNELFFAEYGGTALAVALVNFYRDATSQEGGIATYLHGGSSRERRGVMAPYLLQWRIMQEARRRGCNLYDLWGIDEKKWPGLTRFKKGFGGNAVRVGASVDIVCRPLLYKVYMLWRKLQRG